MGVDEITLRTKSREPRATHHEPRTTSHENVKFEDGYLVISDKPGLGIDVNVEEIEKRPYTPRNLRHYTGTLTDIRPKGDSFYFFEGLDCEHPVF